MRTFTLALLGLAFSSSVACGGDDEEACGAGMVLKDGSCSAASGAGGGGGSGGTGGTTGSDAGGGGESAGEEFGASCATHDDCNGDTDYCAAQPGVPAYCTAAGCDTDASVCPADWTCFNVGQFAPGEPWVCIH